MRKWSSASGMDPLGTRMPKFMLRKVAIAQGFRLCFPDELGEMPYTADEITEGVVVPAVTVTPTKEESELTDEEKSRIAQAPSKQEFISICARLQQEKGTAYRPQSLSAINSKRGSLSRGVRFKLNNKESVGQL